MITQNERITRLNRIPNVSLLKLDNYCIISDICCRTHRILLITIS